jgi:hypothetical protein
MSKYYNKTYRKFTCPLCDRGFPTERQLKAHFKDSHKGVDYSKYKKGDKK